MPITPTYPGVYIEELPGGPPTITGVATSIGAFVDFFPQGPVNEAARILSWADFERQFGGLDSRSEASYAVQQFFLNGGTQAYVVRATSTTSGNAAQPASIVLRDGSNHNTLQATAATAGSWGNNLRIDIDYGTNDPTSLFNLVVSEIGLSGGSPQIVASEPFRNLSLDATQPNYVVSVIANGSQLISLARLGTGARPAQTGTTSQGFAAIGYAWHANTSYPQGTMLVDGNGYQQMATTGGTSGAGPNQPAWKTVDGQQTDDNTVVWQRVPIGAGYLQPWAPNTAYPTLAQIIDANGNRQVATAGGVSRNAPQPPNWNTTFGGTTTDNPGPHAITWTLSSGNGLAIPSTAQIGVTLQRPNPVTGNFTLTALTPPAAITWSWLTGALQSQLRAVDRSLANAAVGLIGTAASLVFLQIKSNTGSPSDILSFSDVPGPTGLVHSLSLADNVQQYALGASITVGAQGLPAGGAQPGQDGVWDPNTDPSGLAGGLIGDQLQKTGMYALLNVDLFNILCIPATMNLPDNNAFAVATDATAMCLDRRAFYILDVPQQTNRDTVNGILDWLGQNATLRNRNAALYFPRLDIPDPLNKFQPRRVAPSGTIAGIYAATDVARGVWKAPAGTQATLAGVQALEYTLIDAENGVLNPLAVNCVRNFPVYGIVCWGARTLNGADQLEDQWKYIPVRRLALFLEESLYRGTQWVVFEPNEEPLWAQIRLVVGAFMQDLFRQGAFAGSTPQTAYLVKCDSETTTSLDQARGVVNILVGFAPLNPAEFVILQIQQLAGQTAS